MKKIISSILIAIVVLQLFAPFSVGVKNKKIAVNTNTVEAVAPTAEEQNTLLNSEIEKMKTAVNNECITKGPLQQLCISMMYRSYNSKIEIWLYVLGLDTTGPDYYRPMIVIRDDQGKIIKTLEEFGGSLSRDETTGSQNVKATFDGNNNEQYDTTIYSSNILSGFTENISYTIDATVEKQNSSHDILGAKTVKIEGVKIYTDDTYDVKSATTSVSSESIGQQYAAELFPDIVKKSEDSLLPTCEEKFWKTLGGCAGQLLYYVIFKPTSAILAISGTLLDISLDYSIKDTSYRSTFVVEGWKVVRDFCNMFFIFVLLYVAFGTILNLNSVRTKEIIIHVILIGLLINFSLFAVQVITDASNILTRVFYNSESIVVGPKDQETGVIQNELGSQGEIKLSEALIAKINPQKLILNASKVDNVKTKDIDNTTKKDPNNGVSVGTFILVTILASVINIVGTITFFICALLFIVRVVGLWLAMILAPIAFFSYTVPELQNIEMIGWKRWWPDTIKMAFMAPIFVFFMYLIVKFLDTGLGLVVNDNAGGITFILGIFVPFIFIMVLLIKAKDITKKMAGTIGDTAMKYASSVGKTALGIAGGAALGLGAGALRGTVGNWGNKLATSDWAKTHGAIGRGLQDVGKWAGSSSFDIRATKLGSKALGKTGADFGKAKEGGYKKHQEEVIAKRRQRSEDLKLGNNSDKVQAHHKAEEEESNLKNKTINEANRIDGLLAAKRILATDLSQTLAAANAEVLKDPEDKKAKEAAEIAKKNFDENDKMIKDLAKERVELNSGVGRHWDKTSDGRVDGETFENFKIEAANKEETFRSKSSTIDADIKTATDKVENNVNEAESELNELKQTLVDETAIANPASPEDMALLQKTKDEVAKAEVKFNNLKASKSEAIKVAEKGVRDELEKADTENTKAQETLSLMTEAANKKGTSIKDVDNRSLDGLRFRIIPKLNYAVEEENAKRINEYAGTIRGRLFNKEANDKAAHEIIMRSEIKK